MKIRYDITGMTCSACSSRVEKCVSKIDGVSKVNVNLLTNSMQVEFGDETNSENIIKAVEKAGYGASVAKEHGALNNTSGNGDDKIGVIEEQMEEMRKKLKISAFFLVVLMYISMGMMWALPLPNFLAGMENAASYGLIQFILTLPIVYVNRNYFIKGFSTLAHKAPNMDSLIAVGSSAAILYGIFALFRISYGLGKGNWELVSRYHHDLYFESAGMILTLITLGKMLETKSKGKTGQALNKLLNLAPKTALLLEHEIEKEVPVDRLKVGDIVIVKSGWSIPIDGTVIEGNAVVDESAITGESMPVYKETGMNVVGATINKNGYLKIQAAKVGEDTTFSQIIKLVEEASSTKAPIARLADKIAGIFVPIVMGISLVTFVIWLLAGATFEFALSCAICVLVISCPCALGLATPVAIMVGTGKGAENGILIKSGETLETLHNVKEVILDKTGTITAGKPEITDLIVYSTAVNSDDLIEIAGILEAKSEHPLAEAVVEAWEHLKGKGYKTEKIQSGENFKTVSGKGIEGTVGGTEYFVGNFDFVRDNAVNGITEQSLANIIKDRDRLAGQGKTPIFVGNTREILGQIAVADKIKDTSKMAVAELQKMGITVTMLTGDNRTTAEEIGRQVGTDCVISEVLPHQKEETVRTLQNEGKIVAMVGDGINDAPALTSADVGIAIGAGTDIAIESADIILMKNDLLDVVTAIRLSKATIKNIKENLFWAFFYNCLGIPVAAGVFYSTFGLNLSPMIGAAAMSCSSLFVVTNALRLKMFKSEYAYAGERSRTRDLKEDEKNKADDESITKVEKISLEKETEKMITMKIEGMMCQHCVNHVKKALEGLEGVVADVNLENKEAKIENTGKATDEMLKNAVEEAGYQVVEIK